MSLTQFNNEYLIFGGEYIGEPWVDPYNPLNLPPYTVRVLYEDGSRPNLPSSIEPNATVVQVSASPNIWDITYVNTDWTLLLRETNVHNILAVLGANSTNVTNMNGMFHSSSKLTSIVLFDTSKVTNTQQMFYGCDNLQSVPLFDLSSVTTTMHMFCFCLTLESVPLFNTHNVTNMYGMFEDCYRLKTIPLFDTTSVTNIERMCCNCTKVENGALALYQQVSMQVNPPTSHNKTFYRCGINTVQGAAELAQIPDDWK